MSQRTVSIKEQTTSNRSISGHDGEFLGVIIGAACAFTRLGNTVLAQEAIELVDQELKREASTFKELLEKITGGGLRRKEETDVATMLIKVSAVMTHNVGDVDQGLSYFTAGDVSPFGKNSSSDTTVPRSVLSKPAATAEATAAALENLRMTFSRLAHDCPKRYDGAYILAKEIYKISGLSAEGHR